MAFVAGVLHMETVRASLMNASVSTEALMRAALIGLSDAVRELIDKGVDVNAKDQDGRTALMEAAFSGHLETTNALLEKGADVNAKDYGGWTALMEAASKGHTDIVRTLLESGADVTAKNSTGWTALKATARGHGEIISMLKSAGAG